MPFQQGQGGQAPSGKEGFQALRIEVNNEMEVLEQVLQTMVRFLAPQGECVLFPFHSLEDRIVKETFREYSRGCICPPDFPQCVCGRSPVLKIVTRKPLEASQQESLKIPDHGVPS